MWDDDDIELAPLETEEDWARLAAAFPDSLLAARYRLFVAVRGLERQMIEAFGSARLYRVLVRVGGWLTAAGKFVRSRRA